MLTDLLIFLQQFPRLLKAIFEVLGVHEGVHELCPDWCPC